jgi:uncharacterized OsmC-like protein
VLVEEKDHSFMQLVIPNSHYWLVDEPVAVGLKNTGPDPYEHKLAGLGEFTEMTLGMYAKRKRLPVQHIKVELTYTRNYQHDCDNCEADSPGIEAILRNIHYARLSRHNKQQGFRNC